MKIRLLSSNVNGVNGTMEDFMTFIGKTAGICHMKENLDVLLAEDSEKSQKRAQMLLKLKHHSPFENVQLTFSFEDIPKILAMVLNNEKVYVTCEKSGRYTKSQLSGVELELYNKWEDIFKKEIMKEYPTLPEGKVSSLAMENARYVLSVFSSKTAMVHTLSIRQLNYVLTYMEEYCECSKMSNFNKLLVPVLKEFCEQMKPWRVTGLCENKNSYLSLFARRHRNNEFGEVYSINYPLSFAALAQAQRHRTLTYEIMIPEDTPRFYTPCIIKGNAGLKNQWMRDLQSVAESYPQAFVVNVNERGTLENFIRKCYERLCGNAQLEIMQRCRESLKIFSSRVVATKPFIYRDLLYYTYGPRCTFGYRCTSPCHFGPKEAFSRKV